MVIEMFWRLLAFAWLAVCVAGLFLVSLKVIGKLRSALKGTQRLTEPLRLATTLVFVGAAGTAMVFFAGGYQLYRLDRAERELGYREVAEAEALMKCEKSSGIILPDGELNLQAIENGNPCTIKGDTRVKLGENAGKMRFLNDWTRPVGLTLFLLFCLPWLFFRAFRWNRKSPA